MTEEKINYKLSINDFEGPIELLLRLIENRKMAINDVSLSLVTDEYIKHINNLDDVDYSYITHFIYVASTLILIKSKSLLPRMELTEEEEQSIEDLQLRLKIYQLFQKRSEKIREVYGKQVMFSRPFKIRRKIAFSPDAKNMKVETFPEVVRGIFGQVPKEEKLPEVRVRTAVHIEEMMNRLHARFQSAAQMSFKDFTHVDLPDATLQEKKVYTVVGFLAVLEMARNGLLELVQRGTFQDIMMEKKEED